MEGGAIEGDLWRGEGAIVGDLWREGGAIEGELWRGGATCNMGLCVHFLSLPRIAQR